MREQDFGCRSGVAAEPDAGQGRGGFRAPRPAGRPPGRSSALIGGPIGVVVGAGIGAGVGAMSSSNTTPKQVNLGNAPWDKSGS